MLNILKMKVYVVNPSWESDKYFDKKYRRVFKKRADAEKFFIKTFVKPWFAKNKKDTKTYFSFDPFKSKLTKAEMVDVLSTFSESGEIHDVVMV